MDGSFSTLGEFHAWDLSVVLEKLEDCEGFPS
jgi:hypothetical protein